MKYPRIALCLLLIAAASEAFARRRAVTPTPWPIPQCASIGGIPVVGLTLDGGVTALPHTDVLEDVQLYTFALAALDRPGQLLAIANRTFVRSDDGGCTWTLDGRMTFPDSENALVAIRGGQAWAWSRRIPALFLVGDTITQRTAPVVPISLHADPNDGARLTLADDQGAVHASDDGGLTWTPLAQTPARPPLYSFEVSRRGRAHMIAGGMADGAHVTFDGGATWTASAGLEKLNVFRIAFSPVNPDVVWAIAADPLGKGEGRRAIFRSGDGGRSFTRILSGSADFQFSNGFTLAPHPVDPTLLYFALAGTTFALIDDRGRIVQRSTLPFRDINAVVFSPASPRVMYFGLKVSDMS